MDDLATMVTASWAVTLKEDGTKPAMTQGRVERYHRSMKNGGKLWCYYFSWELEQEAARFVEYYNHQRYHEARNNVMPADVCHGRHRETLTQRERIKHKTRNLWTLCVNRFAVYTQGPRNLLQLLKFLYL